MIRKAKETDAQKIADIYNYYVENTVITFDESPQSAEKFRESIKNNDPWFVSEEQNRVTGFAYGVQWKEKNAYRFIYESTIYLDKANAGKGIGTKLYKHLIENCRERGLHSLIACIALPYDISVNFHEKLGFKKVGHVPEAGFKFENWVDVGYWQLML